MQIVDRRFVQVALLGVVTLALALPAQAAGFSKASLNGSYSFLTNLWTANMASPESAMMGVLTFNGKGTMTGSFTSISDGTVRSGTLGGCLSRRPLPATHGMPCRLRIGGRKGHSAIFPAQCEPATKKKHTQPKRSRLTRRQRGAVFLNPSPIPLGSERSYHSYLRYDLHCFEVQVFIQLIGDRYTHANRPTDAQAARSTARGAPGSKRSVTQSCIA